MDLIQRLWQYIKDYKYGNRGRNAKAETEHNINHHPLSIDTIANEFKRQNDHREHEDRTTHRFEVVGLWLVGLTLVATVVTAAIFYQTMVEARAAAAKAHHDSVAALESADFAAFQAVWWANENSHEAQKKAQAQASAALESANAASTAALGIATKQLTTLQDTEQRQLRAYVTITDIAIQSRDNTPNVQIALVNSGQSPTTFASYTVSTEIVPAIGRTQLDITKPIMGDEVPIPNMGALQPYTTPLLAVKLPQINVNDLSYVNGAVVILRVRAKYVDVFGKEWPSIMIGMVPLVANFNKGTIAFPDELRHATLFNGADQDVIKKCAHRSDPACVAL